MEAIVVYLLFMDDCTEDYEESYTLGVFSSMENAKDAMKKDIAELEDTVEDSCSEVTKNNRVRVVYRTKHDRVYTIMEYAVDTKWDTGIQKKFLKP
jgi:hypothetical protein